MPVLQTALVLTLMLEISLLISQLGASSLLLKQALTLPGKILTTPNFITVMVPALLLYNSPLTLSEGVPVLSTRKSSFLLFAPVS